MIEALLGGSMYMLRSGDADVVVVVQFQFLELRIAFGFDLSKFYSTYNGIDVLVADMF